MSIICGNILIITILVKKTFLNNHNISSVYQVADGLFTKDNSQAGRLNRGYSSLKIFLVVCVQNSPRMEDSRPDDTCDETHNESVQIDISNVKLEFLKVTGNKADADSDYKSVIYFVTLQQRIKTSHSHSLS